MDDGRRESVTYNGDFQQAYTYNAKGLLYTLTNKVKNSQGVFVESEYYRYLYDASNNMRSKQERIRGISNTTTYNYDKMNRLLRVFEPQRTIVYTYDSRGNRETETVITNNDRTYTEYEYTDNNRLEYETKRQNDDVGQIIQKKKYQYDDNGNMTAVVDITNGSTNLTTNTYTLLNQLETSWTQESNKTMENTYNAEGKRVAKAVDGGQSVRYFYEYNDVVFEYVNGGAVTVFNVIGTNLISREIGSDKVYYFYNGHGDVTALLDATTKNIRSQYQYDSFGNITLEYYDNNGVLTADPDEMIKSQIRYAGYSMMRNQITTTFMQGTMIQRQQGSCNRIHIQVQLVILSLNLYAYCHNEPMMYFDPTDTGKK